MPALPARPLPERLAMLDVLIIGSGFGGAIPAYELASAGLKVCLLERGPWRDTPPVRAAGIGRRAPLPQGRHFLTHVACRVHHQWLPRRGLNLHRQGLPGFYTPVPRYSRHYRYRSMRAVCCAGK